MMIARLFRLYLHRLRFRFPVVPQGFLPRSHVIQAREPQLITVKSQSRFVGDAEMDVALAVLAGCRAGVRVGHPVGTGDWVAASFR